MVRFTKMAVAAVLFGTGLIVGGCQSSSPRAANSQGGITCDRCKLADVRTPYTVPSYEGPRQVGYLTTKQLNCVGCQEAVATYAATGKLDPACKTCGGSRKVAMAN